MRRPAVSLLALGVLIASVLAGSAAGAPGDFIATGVRDIRPGATGSSPAQLTDVNGTLFFRASDGVNGPELWKSDGTPAGTAMVEDAVPGGGIKPGVAGSVPEGLTNVNGTLYFTANDDTNGFELWKSDGTPAGTAMVEDAIPGGGIGPGATGSDPFPLTDVNGTLYFAADDGVNGVELWRTDGTPAGTTMVEDAIPGGGINPGAADSTPGGFSTAGVADVNGTLYFQADDGTNGVELWKSDGTPACTTVVEDAVPGGGINPGVASSSPLVLTNVNGTLYFRADDGANGIELWKSDGTPAGTTIVEDAVPGGGINPGAVSSSPGQLTNVNGILYVVANDGTNGVELWKSDGTPAGTAMVEDTVPGGGIAPGAGNSSPRRLTDVNGTLYFAAIDGANGFELWRSDGTPAGTAMVEDAVPGGGINPGAASSNPGGSSTVGIADVNGILFFSADDGTNGIELWRSDGSPGGTTMVEDAVSGGGINPGVAGSVPETLTNVAGTLFFSADDGANGAELWKVAIEGPAPSVVPAPAAVSQATGLRAAALKKCKKKKSKKRRKKCRRRALRLPL